MSADSDASSPSRKHPRSDDYENMRLGSAGQGEEEKEEEMVGR